MSNIDISIQEYSHLRVWLYQRCDWRHVQKYSGYFLHNVYEEKPECFQICITIMTKDRKKIHVFSLPLSLAVGVENILYVLGLCFFPVSAFRGHYDASPMYYPLCPILVMITHISRLDLALHTHAYIKTSANCIPNPVRAQVGWICFCLKW